MSRRTDEIFELVDGLTKEECHLVLNHLRQRVPIHPLEQKWDTTAEMILTAIARSSDLTQRGIRGIIAEATFEASVVPQLAAVGWNTATIVGDQAYDFLLEKEAKQIRVQVKLQRREAGTPKEYAKRSRSALRCPSGKFYVVEVQKTRSGTKNGEKTRPYHFGDFDILAVNMHASSAMWNRFMYTVGTWLIPRSGDTNLIEIFQPVPECPDDYWTDNLMLCVDWFLSGKDGRLYS